MKLLFISAKLDYEKLDLNFLTFFFSFLVVDKERIFFLSIAAPSCQLPIYSFFFLVIRVEGNSNEPLLQFTEIKSFSLPFFLLHAVLPSKHIEESQTEQDEEKKFFFFTFFGKLDLEI